ncbi:MAG: phosphomannomutase/phosphoglucomutase [Blautia sp.]|nr:phosphomannomutase/phosphoglucomutase [Blautia sp.]
MSDFENLFFRLQNGNDVRGIAIATEEAPATLTKDMVAFITRAFASWLSGKTNKAKDELRIGVGHDSRLSAEMMEAGCLIGLAGTQIFLCHLSSTPSMFQSTVYEESNFDAAIMITASHLPYPRNGLKFFTREGALEKSQLTEILKLAVELAEKYGSEDTEAIVKAALPEEAGGQVQDFDLVDVYSRHMCDYVKKQVQAPDYDQPLAGLHIVLDAGNGAAGFFADKILAALGADTAGSICLNPDGTFPVHVPNPENSVAMDAIRKATLDAHADLGVIFDCDGDRGAVVLSDGKEVNRNRLIAMLAKIVSEDYPGTTIVTDSVTSDELADFLEGTLKMKHLRFKRGYKNVINKGIELNAAGQDCELAIETSGHGAFKDNYFSDDGAYIGIKIICQLARMRQKGLQLESLLEGFAEPAEAVERRYAIVDEPGDERDFHSYGASVIEAFRAFAGQNENLSLVEPNYEGVRVAFDNGSVKGWMLVRQSLHDPEIPVNIEAKQNGGVQAILDCTNDFFAQFTRLKLK